MKEAISKMKTVTIQISDEDYKAVVRHMSRDLDGKRLVAVIAAETGTELRNDILAARKEIRERERNSKPGATAIANPKAWEVAQ